MDNQDPFSEFGGSVNPFAEFNGTVVNPNPFAEFGGSPNPPTKVPAKQFMANYMDSPIYQKRLSNFNITAPPNTQHLLNTPITFNDGQANDYKVNSKTGKYGINVDRQELSEIKDKPDDVLAHELSHSSRDLSPSEQDFIASKNKSDLGYGLYSQYYAARAVNGYKGSFDNFQSNGHGTGDDAYHDFRANENKADLDAFRFMMYKKGIYDTSKRDMTIDDFNKAKADKDISKSMMFNRLLKQFKPEDIIKINNTIAMNKTPSPYADTANIG